MIIVCPECSTQFNVNSDRIPDKGTKVRCARCKHVFLIEKPLEQQSPLFDKGETFHGVPVSDSMEQSPYSDKSSNETTATESDFNYDKFQELDSNVTVTEAFTFSAAAETEDDFTFTESAEESVSTIEKVFAAAGNQKPSASEVPAAADEEVSRLFTAAQGNSAEPEIPEPLVQGGKSSPVSSIIRVLLLLILGVLIVGGVFVYMNGTDQLNQTIQQIFGQQIDRPAEAGQITLSQLEGKFVQNQQDGEFFLIHGIAINNFSEPRAAMQVKGVIFDQNGRPLLQKTVFCGNAINEDQLLSLSFSELEKIMGNQFGNNLSNMKIDSKQSIPFDIVFKDLPKNISEFSVKVTSSQPAT
jgi:predicted Zn finger-like uncharacterized protein